MFQDGDVQDSKVLQLSDDGLKQHAKFERELFHHHLNQIDIHRESARNKAWYNPTRLYNYYKIYCGVKKCDTSGTNLRELGKAAADQRRSSGAIYLSRTASGKGRHYQAITTDQAYTLRDHFIMHFDFPFLILCNLRAATAFPVTPSPSLHSSYFHSPILEKIKAKFKPSEDGPATPATPEAIRTYSRSEESKLADANRARQKHKYDKSTRWRINPARYYHQIQETKANKQVTAHVRNLTQLGSAEKTGCARFGKTKSGKDHITAVNSDLYNEQHKPTTP
ncbi:uncharacterized protein FA14DRAFT_182130 [Meira miltonrushii]|uniref:Uncharacterized protein n=1 Tax=Meira miltonrushii TaxID=1280837 RepID=A0A316V5C0_9BASI|nr:uncharacterized protein FA14DRAFT_182130 [Meira miltonrushii]PWN32218.1 hypothetical protein FA14DRAFT_182130 [Meira miltonrushii]